MTVKYMYFSKRTAQSDEDVQNSKMRQIKSKIIYNWVEFWVNI